MRIIIIAIIIVLLFICFTTLCACRVAGMADEKFEKLSDDYEKGNLI